MTLNKMPVSWHEECLKNMKVLLENEIKYFMAQKERTERLKSECDVLDAQILKAKKLKVESFDRNEAKFTKDLCITVQV